MIQSVSGSFNETENLKKMIQSVSVSYNETIEKSLSQFYEKNVNEFKYVLDLIEKEMDKLIDESDEIKTGFEKLNTGF